MHSKSRGLNALDSSERRAPCPIHEREHTPSGLGGPNDSPGQPSQRQSAFNRFAGLLGPPSFKYFNVAIATAEAAAEATTNYLDDPERLEISVVRALSLREIAALGLAAGDVKPA
jgi:hypothetical protein